MVRTLAATVAACAALLAPATAAAAPAAHSSVIGGEPAAIADAPWLAYIEGSTDLGPFTCTGSVIAPRVVLTAGHCVQEPGEYETLPARTFRVVTGVSDVRTAPGRTISKVERVVFYPSFKTSRVEIDAGLLILSAPVASPALTLATPSDSALLAAGTPIEIAGWGVLGPEDVEIPAQAHKGELELQSPSYCLAHTKRGPYAAPRYAPAGQLCALDRPDFRTSGCFGDSGAAAVARRADGVPVGVGIVASGSATCARREVNVYTRVDRISAWALGWAAAVETGASPPPTPELTPSYLSFSRAEELDYALLRGVFGERYLDGTRKRSKCSRLAWERVRCRVAWRQGGDRFYGSIGVDLTIDGEDLVTTRDLTIHWVDERCQRGERSQRCRVRARRVTRSF